MEVTRGSCYSKSVCQSGTRVEGLTNISLWATYNLVYIPQTVSFLRCSVKKIGPKTFFNHP